jgi:hypothetical protein
MYLKKILTTIVQFSFLSGFILTANSLAKDADPVDELTEQLASKATLSHPLTFCRTQRSEIVAQYADTLGLENGWSFELNSPTSHDHSRKMSQEAAIDGYKSHVLAGSVYVYEQGDACRSKKRIFTNSLFYPEDEVSAADLPIDWVSNSSKSIANSNFLRVKSTQPGGHSEPQFISDFEAKWMMDSTTVVNYFTPHTKTEKEKAEAVVMCGLELHGPFDMCDTCLNKLCAFRCEHQSGQTSISQAIRDQLKEKFKGKAEDAFMMVYHSWYPYKDSSYSADTGDGESVHALTYTYTARPRQDFFERRIKGGDDTYTLSQSAVTQTQEGVIYGHMHLLSDKKATYDVSTKTFVF